MATTGRYVPPHMRNRPSPSAPPGPSSPAPSRSAYPGPPHSSSHHSAPRTPSRPSDRDNHNNHYASSPSYSNHSNSAPRVAAPSLHVFGDSFAGPFKLLDSSSARGLNNPKSIKQVSNDLVPLLNQLLAPPPYSYLPPAGRYALLLFGNVDLQINYLWQLQHKPLVPATWDERRDGEFVEASAASTPLTAAETVLANATENLGKGPALGPERFVDNIVKAYTAWLEREVVNGPIGRRAAEVAAQASGETGGRAPLRRLAPTKVLVGAALPPLVQDETLPRIPEKYVERLEEDHVKAQRALERGSERSSRTPWAKTPVSTAEIDDAMAKVSISNGHGTDGTATPSTPSLDAPAKVSVSDLLAHDPPLCTKPVRIEMTQRFNAALRAFCDLHPNVLEFVDISADMLALDAAEREAGGDAPPEIANEVDRATWACPVDLSNIHPLWEPTLPLWLKKLKAIGIPTDSFSYAADAEETMRAYEEDKKRRTHKRDGEYGWQGERIKLRDE